MRARYILTLTLAVAALALSACASKDVRFASISSEPSARIASRYSGIEVAEVTLPTYADTEQIYAEDATGAIKALGPLWADDPSRAMTLQLSRDLAAITGAKVAPAPWPFSDFADVKVDVRMEEMVATEAGLFQLSGQYFVAPGTSGADRSGSFTVAVRLSDRTSPTGIAAARAAAVSKLAEKIAGEGLK